MFVRRWMTTPPAMLLADTPVGDALRFMESRHLGHLAVIGRSGIEGLVTREDLRIAAGKGDAWTPRRHLELGRRLRAAAIHHVRAAGSEGAAGGQPGQIGRLTLDGGEPVAAVPEPRDRLEERLGIGMRG